MSSVPKETNSFYSLRDPSEVKILLYIKIFRSALICYEILTRLTNATQVQEFLLSLVRWKKLEKEVESAASSPSAKGVQAQAKSID